MGIHPSRILDYVYGTEERVRTAASDLMLVPVPVLEYLFAQWRAGVQTVDAVRASAAAVTFGNCSSARQDLDILEHLAQRAVNAGLTDGLHPSIQAKLSEGQP